MSKMPELIGEAILLKDKEILRLRAENEKLRSENEKLVAQSWVVDAAILSECEENEKLRAALKPFADRVDDFIPEKHDAHRAVVTLGEIRTAAAALKETGK